VHRLLEAAGGARAKAASGASLDSHYPERILHEPGTQGLDRGGSPPNCRQSLGEPSLLGFVGKQAISLTCGNHTIPVSVLPHLERLGLTGNHASVQRSVIDAGMLNHTHL